MKQLIYESLAAMGQRLDQDGVRRWGERLGGLLWAVMRERREMAVEGIMRHIGLEDERARAMARENFGHTGRAFTELFLSRRVDPRFVHEQVVIGDPDSFEAMRATKRPMVGISGHLGAWEMMTPVMHVFVPDRPKQIVARKPKDEALHAVMTRLRSQPTVEVVDHRNAVLKVLRNLKKGGATAFLVDHNCSTSEAIFMPFLGSVAAVNMGPALLAVRGGAVIQPMFLVRQGQGYLLHTEPYLDTRELTGSREDKIHKAALFYTRAVERTVRRWPEQWYWLHRRWKTQPPTDWMYVPPES
jgi:KDO2-lipid IV(A) lauroyltransferase